MSNEISKFLIYNTPNNEVRVDVYLEDETIWLTQKAMSELFGVVKSTISEHLSTIYESGELIKDSTVRNFRTVQMEGKRKVNRDLEYYNLDAIISVGYRVNSSKATQFRIWATQTLKEYIIKDRRSNPSIPLFSMKIDQSIHGFLQNFSNANLQFVARFQQFVLK